MSVSSSTMGGGRTKYKLILLGDQSVGKSSIIEKYIKDKFEEGFNVNIIYNLAHSRNRFSYKKCHKKWEKLSYSALGYSRSVKVS